MHHRSGLTLCIIDRGWECGSGIGVDSMHHRSGLVVCIIDWSWEWISLAMVPFTGFPALSFHGWLFLKSLLCLLATIMCSICSFPSRKCDTLQGTTSSGSHDHSPDVRGLGLRVDQFGNFAVWGLCLMYFSWVTALKVYQLEDVYIQDAIKGISHCYCPEVLVWFVPNTF